MAICNLSYDGDFRMLVGENPNKVRNIVEGQMELFRQLYAPVVAAQSNYMELANGNLLFSCGRSCAACFCAL